MKKVFEKEINYVGPCGPVGPAGDSGPAGDPGIQCPQGPCGPASPEGYYYDSQINTYDRPIHTIEKDNRKIFMYEAAGMNESQISVDEEFINKTKQLYVRVRGTHEDTYADWSNSIDIRPDIDYATYSSYAVFMNNGIIVIELHEIINERPNVSRVK